MPHEFLKRRNPHLLISFMSPERMPQRVDADLLADTGLLHIFRNDILD